MKYIINSIYFFDQRRCDVDGLMPSEAQRTALRVGK